VFLDIFVGILGCLTLEVIFLFSIVFSIFGYFWWYREGRAPQIRQRKL
jgi:hypothetical protein